MSQNTQILSYLKQGKKITPIDALNKFGCFRLSARILDLRKSGHPIITQTITKQGKTFASYSMSTKSMAQQYKSFGGNNVR
tara:strand:+ start:95 stop:337 length:243 start_codon:yes stop_codon:yes gene_type:complete